MKIFDEGYKYYLKHDFSFKHGGNKGYAWFQGDYKHILVWSTSIEQSRHATWVNNGSSRWQVPCLSYKLTDKYIYIKEDSNDLFIQHLTTELMANASKAEWRRLGNSDMGSLSSKIQDDFKENLRKSHRSYIASLAIENYLL